MSKSRNRKSSGSQKTSGKLPQKRRQKVQLIRFPSIEGPGFDAIGEPCIAFEKYDGSNLQFSWSQSAGWFRNGTRKRTILPGNPLFGSAIEMFGDIFCCG